MAGVIILLALIVSIIIATAPAAADSHGITFQADKKTVLFWFNGTGERALWSFGDGTVGYGFSPAHIYDAGGTYLIMCKITTGQDEAYYFQNITIEQDFLDIESQTLNAGNIHVPGMFLTVVSAIMLALSKAGEHPLRRYIGKDGKQVLGILYGLGLLCGLYLIIMGAYG
jgi:hypothetical protein